MKYNKNELVLGLDVGITSVGWALIDDSTNNLVEFGVRRFDQATAASEARVNRSARRTNRRKNWRKQQIKNAFNDFNIIQNEEMMKKGYSDFTATHKSKTLDQSLSQISEKTVYHLRNKALTEKVSLRELFISIYNIAKTRGMSTLIWTVLIRSMYSMLLYLPNDIRLATYNQVLSEV